MREEKKLISDEYITRLNASPYFIVVDYSGLKVDQFAEYRNRLSDCTAEVHVVKNSLFALAAKEVGIEGIRSDLSGQMAVITGDGDISAAAKITKTFHAEFERPTFRFGYLDSERLEAEQLSRLADLPPLDVLRGQLVGVIQAPAARLVRLLNTPATQMAQVLKAYSEKES